MSANDADQTLDSLSGPVDAPRRVIIDDELRVEMGYLYMKTCSVRVTTEGFHTPLPQGKWVNIELPPYPYSDSSLKEDKIIVHDNVIEPSEPNCCCCIRCNLVLSKKKLPIIQTEHCDSIEQPLLQFHQGGPRFDGTIKDLKSNHHDTKTGSYMPLPMNGRCTCRRRRKGKRSDAALLMGLVLTCQEAGQVKIESAKLRLMPDNRTEHHGVSEQGGGFQDQDHEYQPCNIHTHPTSSNIPQNYQQQPPSGSHQQASLLITVSFPHLLARHPHSRIKDSRRRIASHSSNKLLPASTQLLLSIIRSDWDTFEDILNGRQTSSISTQQNPNRADPHPPMFPYQLSLEEVYKRISVAGSSLKSRPKTVHPIVPPTISGNKALIQRVNGSYLLALPRDTLELCIAKPFLRARSLDALRCTCTSMHHMLRAVVPGMKLQLYAHQVNSLCWMRRREIRKLEENDFLHSSDCDDDDVTVDRLGLLSQEDGDAHRALSGGATVYLRPRKQRPTRDSAVPVKAIRIAQDTGIEVDFPTNGAVSRKVGRCGLLCDSPGLGKTISILSLILQTLGLSTFASLDSSRSVVSTDEEMRSDNDMGDANSSNERIFLEYWKEYVVADYRRLLLNRLLTSLERADMCSVYFVKPVDPEKDSCEDYFDVVEHPICFQDIRKKIKGDKYGENFSLFVSDIELCFRNAIVYNPPENDVHQAAQRLEAQFKDIVQSFKSSQIQTAHKSFSRASTKKNSGVSALIEKKNRKKFLESLVPSSGTLIVVPGVLMEHWQMQLRYHVDLKYCTEKIPIVFEYAGTTKCGLRMREIVIQCKVKNTHFPFAFLDHTGTKRLPSPEFLAMFSIVITTNQRFTNEWKNGSFEDELRRKSNEEFHSALRDSEESCPLLKINWLRLVVDEGHSMGRGRNNSAICFASWITAERRWAMTGTPTRQTVTQSGLSNIHGLMGYLQHDFFSHYRNGYSTWQNLVTRSWNSGYLASFFRIQKLLKVFMVRHTKKDIEELPPPKFVTSVLKMSSLEVTTYNTLVCGIQSNLLLTSMKAKVSALQDSLLHRSQAQHANRALSNVRLVCAGGTRVVPTLTDKNWNEFLEILKTHNPSKEKYQQAQQYLHRAVTEHLTPCACCGMHLSSLLVFPCCGNLICTECVDSKSNICIVCDKKFDPDDFQKLQPGFDLNWVHNIEEENKTKKNSTKSSTTPAQQNIPSVQSHVVLDGGPGHLAPRDPETPRRRTRNPGDGHKCEYDMKSSNGECVLCWKEHDSCNLMNKAGRCPVCYRRAEACPQSESKSYYVIERLLELHRSQQGREAQRPVKVIIFSQFRKVLNLVGDRILRRIGAGCVAEYWGKYRKQELHKFIYDKECLCMLLGKDGSEGLDLSFCTHIVFLEQVWDKSLENQVIARAWRMGAKGAVEVETLIAEDSVEETMRVLEGANRSNGGEDDVNDRDEGDEGEITIETAEAPRSDKSSEYRRAKLHFLLKGLQLIKNTYTLSFGAGTKRKVWSFADASIPCQPKKPKLGKVRFQDPVTCYVEDSQNYNFSLRQANNNGGTYQVC